jgi:hypothetical protein
VDVPPCDLPYFVFDENLRAANMELFSNFPVLLHSLNNGANEQATSSTRALCGSV